MTITRFFFLIVVFGMSAIQQTYAEETDQFTLPPGELLDIGPLASQKLYHQLETVIARTNSEIQTLLPKASHSRYAASQLALRRNDAYLIDLLYNKTGPGFPHWLRWNRASQEASKPIQYKEIRPWKTVYWLSFSQSPLSLIGLTPTINMYGHYFGTDKLGHFFMQGHTYYQIYTHYINQGKAPSKARAAIVTYGKILEQTYLGTLVNGIYSNGDLSANYAGWKFYMNLAHSVKIGKHTLPPILVLKGDQWEFSSNINKENLLKPYISDNLNEALNPSRYTFTRSQIRRQVKKRCPDWIKRRGITQQTVDAKLKETLRWHGEAYGHWLPVNNAVTLNTCFGGK
ncbi:MAG: hypothetical protein Q8M03_13440 [Legionella sp.]|nr:hypothetical protein [Legionella sp.]